jgi:hypothetical protein
MRLTSPTLLLLSAANALPMKRQDAPFYGVLLQYKYWDDDRLYQSPWGTIDLNKLIASPDATPVAGMLIVQPIDLGVDRFKVQYRAYKDEAGTIPAGPPFGIL